MRKGGWQDFTLEFLFTKWTLGSAFTLVVFLMAFKVYLLFLRKIETLFMKYHPATIFYKTLGQ